MSDPVGELYGRKIYPPMSHPVSDPAVTAIAARLAGLKPPHPATARILEIGCGTGHHLIPLAQRWPLASFTGIDISVDAIGDASRRAVATGIGNVSFLVADLRTAEFGEQRFDYVIAHGFFSWVPDDVKAALFRFCAHHLSPTGIATLSFNVWAGWKERFPIVHAGRKIQEAEAIDEGGALGRLRAVIEDPHVRWIIDDMLAKGPDILLFDDFGPVNDAWPLDRFVMACAEAGLQWLGESDPANNVLPSWLDDEQREGLAALAANPLQLWTAADEITGTAFRSPIFCRQDAPLERLSTAIVLEMCVRAGEDEVPPSADPLLRRFLEELRRSHPACLPLREILARMGEVDIPRVARAIYEAINSGQLRARIDPVHYIPEPVSPVALDAFRLQCAREKIPLVDAWHIPCAFPNHHYDLLALMDGTRSTDELAALAVRHCPDLDFQPWLRHLAGRGMFA